MTRKPSRSPSPPLLFQPPSAHSRKWINLGMALFLASQVAIPLTYYLYKEPADERFAWRMFSSVHMGDWSRLSIVERHRRGNQILQQAVPVKQLLVESSWKNLEAGHPDYRDKFLRYYLEQSGADEVRYEAQGFWPSGEPMEPVRASIHRRDGVVRLLDK